KCEWLPNLQPDGFPIAHPHRLFRALLVEFPVKELMLVRLLLSEERWEHRNSIDVCRGLHSGNLRSRREKIPEGPDLLAHCPGFDFSRPPDDHGNPNS